MAVPTVAEQRTRIEALCALIETETDGVYLRVLTGDECTLEGDGATFPAVEVRTGAASRMRISNGTQIQVTRSWELWLFVEKVCKPGDMDSQRDAIEACDPYLERIPDFFEARTRLENDDAGIVYNTTVMQDSGAVLTPYNTSEYSFIRFTFGTILVKQVLAS